MSSEPVIVSCDPCDLTESFDSIGAAREFVENHRTETGHEPTWELPSLASGVERAGDEAGVCGRPDCTETASPLYRGSGRS